MIDRRLAALLLVLAAGPARPDDGAAPAGKLAKDVDFSRPPNEVEAYNKVRFECTLDQGAKGATLRVDGRAYYPDGVALQVTVRYAKHRAAFGQGQAIVADRRFTLTLGPFPRALPEGELVVEAWFLLARQPDGVRERMTAEKYFSCTPPCRWDQRSATRVSVARAGAEGQAKAERAEKAQVERLLTGLVGAADAAETVLVAKQPPTPEAARAALATLEADLKAAAASWTEWRGGWQFLLFPRQAAEAEALGVQLLQVGRHQVAAAGTPVDGVPADRQAAFTEGARLRAEARERVEALRGFLAEAGTLDRQWKELNDAAQRKFDETQRAGGQAPGATPGNQR